MGGAVDLFLIYQFIKRLATPFKDWEAFKEGVINEKGEVLIKSKDRHTVAQRKSLQKFDLLVLKLKKLLEKVPGGNTRLGSFAAAMWLIKENDEAIEAAETLTEEDLMIAWSEQVSLIAEKTSINEQYEFFEETNVAGADFAQQYTDSGANYSRKLKKNKKPAEIGTDELVRRYRKGVPGQSVKEAHAPGGYKPRAVGPNTKPADVRGVPLGSKRPMVNTKTKETQSDGSVKTVTKKVAGNFSGKKRSELKVGSDDRTTKR